LELLSFDQKVTQIPVTGKKIAEESRKLLHECATKHSLTCPAGLITRLPTRVLDINSDRTAKDYVFMSAQQMSGVSMLP
jgi:hypothetical protein